MDIVCTRCGEFWNFNTIVLDEPASFKRHGALITECPACTGRTLNLTPVEQMHLRNYAAIAKSYGDDLELFGLFLEFAQDDRP